MTTATETTQFALPVSPFDGQEFIDVNRVKWKFDSELNCWVRIGTVQDFPLATSDQAGLLSIALKNLVDKIAHKGGGYGIIVDPKLAVRSQDNPDGVVFGDVDLISNAFDIGCVFADGDQIGDDCLAVPFAPEVDEQPPGFDLNFTEDFLNTFCIEIPGGPGPRGDKGDVGEDGAAGTGDGPRGEQGDAGDDATQIAEFSGVEIEDVDDIFDTAVVNLELDNDEGVLHVVKSRVRVPDNDVPADKVIATRLERSLNFTTDFSFTINKGDDDLEADVPIAAYPSGSFDSDLDEVQLATTKLSDYVGLITSFYQDKLDDISEQYDDQLEELFKETDEAARQKLDILAEELANCEFQLPLNYCIGISPQDCNDFAGDIVESSTSFCALAGFLSGDTTAFCSDSSGTDLGVIKVGANEIQEVRFQGSDQLPAGLYVLIYISGVLEDCSDIDRGFFVGDPQSGVGVEVDSIPDGGSATTINVSVSNQTSLIGDNKFDSKFVEEFWQGQALADKSVVVRFVGDGGNIIIKAPTPSSDGTGSVVYRVIRCEEC